MCGVAPRWVGLGWRACESAGVGGQGCEAGGGTMAHESVGITEAQGASSWVSYEAEFRAF